MRRKRKFQRKILPDFKYNSVLIQKFINYVMRKGKKTIAQKIVYGALDNIKEKTKQNPLEIIEKAIKNASPLLELRSRRIGGANYQVPVEVSLERQIALAMRWIINAAKSKKGQSMIEKLSEELILASKNEGAAVKKKNDVHKMAEANRAFAHFTW